MSDFTLALIGDVMLGRGVNEYIGRRDPALFWGDVLPVLNDSDAVIANLECAITAHHEPWKNTYKFFHFGANPDAIDVLKAANIQCVNLANNHILDFDYTGLHDTLHHLDQVGIHHTGAGRNINEARQPAVFEAGGRRIAVIGMTDNEPPFAASEQRGGTLHTNFRQVPAAIEQLDAALEKVKANPVDFIVLSLHWGPNMVEYPPDEFQQFAHEAIDRGVDIIHGHSAHVFQAVEIYNGGAILYDTGDFLDDYTVNPDLRNDWSFVFLVEVDAASVSRLRLIPVKLSYAEVNHARGDDFDGVRKKAADRFHVFNTALRETDEGFEINLAEAVASE